VCVYVCVCASMRGEMDGVGGGKFLLVEREFVLKQIQKRMCSNSREFVKIHVNLFVNLNVNLFSQIHSLKHRCCG